MKRYFQIILFLVFTIEGFAQKKFVGLEELKAPTAPAANVIGIQPTDISRPKSAKDLEAAIFSNFIGENNSLVFPEGYSIEVMPFWMVNRKNFNEIGYLNNDKTFWHNLSFSVASTSSFVISDSIKTNALGLGFRSLIYRSQVNSNREEIIRNIFLSRINSEVVTVMQSLIAKLSEENKISLTDFDVVISEVRNRIIDYYRDQTDDYGKHYGEINEVDYLITFQSIVDKLKATQQTLSKEEDWDNALNTILKELKSSPNSKLDIEEQITNFLTNREGLQIEIASGTSLNFPTNKLDFSVVPKWGVWLTTTYQNKEDSKFQYLGLVRFMRNDVRFYEKYKVSDSVEYTNNFDLGIKTVYSLNRFTADLELLYRHQNLLLKQEIENNATISTWKNESDYKWTFNLNYQLDENIILSYSFGKSFESTAFLNGNIISVASLNFGFGGPRVILPKD